MARYINVGAAVIHSIIHMYQLAAV